MRKILLTSACLALAGLCPAQKKDWKTYANPAEAGFDTQTLKEVALKLESMKTSSYMIVSDGHVVFTSGDISNRFMCHSIRKSFMSAMFGIYEDRGLIDLKSTLHDLNVDDHQSLTDTEKSATVENLLTARSGIYHPAAYEPRSMKKNRPERGSATPGEVFFYNNWDFNTLHTILEQEAQISFFEAFRQEIATPLEMQDLRMEDMNYRVEPDLSRHSAYLFKMSARDLAKFGQLYLNNGNWDGRQIIPEKWIKKTTKAFSTDLPGFEDRDAYGFLWWVDSVTYGEPCYYASGLGGHRILVFPESKLVIVHQVNSYYNLKESDKNIRELISLSLKAKTSKKLKNAKLVTLEVSGKNYPPSNLDPQLEKKIMGTYQHPFFKDITLIKENGIYRIKGQILGSFRIFPTDSQAGLFLIEDIPNGKVLFKRADENNPKGKAITRFSKDRVPEKMVLYY